MDNPYHASNHSTFEAEETNFALRHAARKRRVLAALIDFLVFIVSLALVVFPVGYAAASAKLQVNTYVGGAALIQAVVMLFIFGLCMLKARTPGMALFRLLLVNNSNNPLFARGAFTIALRNFAFIGFWIISIFNSTTTLLEFTKPTFIVYLLDILFTTALGLQLFFGLFILGPSRLSVFDRITNTRIMEIQNVPLQ